MVTKLGTVHGPLLAPHRLQIVSSTSTQTISSPILSTTPRIGSAPQSMSHFWSNGLRAKASESHRSRSEVGDQSTNLSGQACKEWPNVEVRRRRPEAGPRCGERCSVAGHDQRPGGSAVASTDWFGGSSPILREMLQLRLGYFPLPIFGPTGGGSASPKVTQ